MARSNAATWSTNEAHQTKLTSEMIGNPLDATELFGGERERFQVAKGTTPIMCIPIPTCRLLPFITIPSGCYALVTKGGSDEDFVGQVFDELTGQQIALPAGHTQAWWPAGCWKASIMPWDLLRVSHLVTKQSIVFDTPVSGCKTQDNVTVHIDMCLVFRLMGDPTRGEDPELVREFVHKLGAVELQNQLNDAQDERVRALARNVNHTEVYGLRSEKARGYTPGTAPSIVPITVPQGDGDGAASAHAMDAPLDQLVGGAGIELTSTAPSAPPAHRDSGAVTVDFAAMVGGVHSASAPGVESLDTMKITEEMKAQLNKQFNKSGVEITDVAIQSVRLPDKFARTMEQATMYTSDSEMQTMKQKFDLQKVDHDEQFHTEDQRRREEQAQEEENGKMQKAVERKKLDAIKADTRKIVAEIKETERAEVLKIQAEAALEVQKLNSEKQKILKKHQAEAEAEAEKLKAEADAYVDEKRAQASLERAKKAAEGKKVIARAEGSAATKLAAKRNYELQKQQIEGFAALASNPSLVVTGNTGDRDMLADLLVAQRQGNIMLNVDAHGRTAPGGR